jgi:hypothetical protein
MTARRLYFLVSALLIAVAAAAGRAAQPEAPRLILEAPGAAVAASAAAPFGGPDTVQFRAVVANLPALDADVLDVAVSPGRTLRAVLRTRTTTAEGFEWWSGQISGAPLSAATFVRAGDLLQGSIRTLDAAYSIEPLAATGLHVVRQVDLSALGRELPSLVPPSRPEAFDKPPVSPDDGTVFDVLVVYTPAARSAAGGSDAAIRSRINLGVNETNTAYTNSGITPRLHLVGAELVDYTESGDLGTDLGAVTSIGDGIMDAVHGRRDALGADLVQLVVGNAAGGACGIAWLMNSLAPSFADYAFSVTAYPCISPNYTFGHELGHNMGSNHAPEDGMNNAPLYPYSFGYKHPANLFRTIMAYECAVSSCPRILYFSNPAVLYNGAPTGTATQNNNALSINNARVTVANFRASVSVNTAPMISTISNRTTPEDTPAGPIGFTIADAQTAAGSLLVTASSSNPAVVASGSSGLTLGGSSGARTLVVTPQPDASGTTTITVVVSDGALSSASSFLLTVSSVNDPPVVSTITAQTMSEDESLSVSFRVRDVDTPAGSLTVQATSSNSTLIGPGGLGLGGSGEDRVVLLTPTANASGLATITLSVGDGVDSTQSTFALTVIPVNDPPSFVSLPPVVSTTVGQPASMAVIVTDPDSIGSSLTLGVTSTNTTLIAAAGIVVAPGSWTSTSRTFQMTLTPEAGQVGAAVLMFRADDGGTPATAAVAFNVTATTAAPDAPTALSTTVTGTSVAFSWTPAMTGTAPTSFTLEIGSHPGTTTLPTQSVLWPQTTLTLVLPAGTYYARVRAVNGIGASVPSPEVTVLVSEPSPIPGPPGNFAATVSGRTVSFSWTASTLGAAATSYTIEAGSAPGLSNLARLVTGTPNTSFSVANVPAGTYWVRARGSNAAGAGAPSQDVAIVMGEGSGCVGLPGPPVLLTPVTQGYNVTLSWNAPALGGRTTSYILFAGSAPGLSNLAVIDTRNASTSFAASAPAGVYYVRVAAANGCGVGPASTEVSFSVGAGLPGAPIDLTGTVARDGGVSLSWTAPSAGEAPSGYLLEAGSAPGQSNLARIATGSLVTGFFATAPPGRYYVRVRAVNAVGTGPASNEIVLDVPAP